MLLAFYNIAIFDKFLGFLAQTFEPALRMYDYKEGTYNNLLKQDFQFSSILGYGPLCKLAFLLHRAEMKLIAQTALFRLLRYWKEFLWIFSYHICGSKIFCWLEFGLSI